MITLSTFYQPFFQVNLG